MLLFAAASALGVLARPAEGKSSIYRSLEMSALASERIGLVRVTAVRDSMYPSPAVTADRTVRFRTLRWLRGGGRTRGSIVLFVYHEDPPPLSGDTLLVLWEVDVRPHVGDPQDTLRYLSVFDLTHPERGYRRSKALTGDFRVIHSPDSILAAVERRMAMVRAGRPLGDARCLTMKDFAAGLGCLERSMPWESEAEQATYWGSINSLRYPADIELLPTLLDSTRSTTTLTRAWAAGSLAQYPRDLVVPRLRQLLLDDGLTYWRRSKAGGGEDTTWVPIVRDNARNALKALRTDTTMPAERPGPRSAASDSTR